MNEQAILRERLRKVEALLARPGHEGERLAAQAAVDRLRERLADLSRQDPISELLFPLADSLGLDLLAAFERQRLAAYSLYRGNLDVARGANAFVRTFFGPRFEDLARFWGVDA
jgi:hypothetical protein